VGEVMCALRNSSKIEVLLVRAGLEHIEGLKSR